MWSAQDRARAARCVMDRMASGKTGFVLNESLPHDHDSKLISRNAGRFQQIAMFIASNRTRRRLFVGEGVSGEQKTVDSPETVNR